MRLLKPYEVMIACPDCPTTLLYKLSKECDHNDGHVLEGHADSKSCRNCKLRSRSLDNLDAPHVWWSPTLQKELNSEEELLEAEGLN